MVEKNTPAVVSDSDGRLLIIRVCEILELPACEDIE